MARRHVHAEPLSVIAYSTLRTSGVYVVLQSADGVSIIFIPKRTDETFAGSKVMDKGYKYCNLFLSLTLYLFLSQTGEKARKSKLLK